MTGTNNSMVPINMTRSAIIGISIIITRLNGGDFARVRF